MKNARSPIFGFVLLVAPIFPATAYVSPFAITLDPDAATWASDYTARMQTLDEYATPSLANWYTTTNYTSLTYGPIAPELFSSATADLTLVKQIHTTKNPAVYNVPMNTRPAGVDAVTWEQQRLLYAADQLIGTHYQHLHLSDFNPALVTNGSFTWDPVSNNPVLDTVENLHHGTTGTASNPYAATYGSAQPGLDCSNFTAEVYNVALGIQLNSGILDQVQFSSGDGPTTTNRPKATVIGTDGQAIQPQFFLSPTYGTGKINAPGSLDGVISELQPGDLLYIEGAGDVIAHVVIWLGDYGTNADGTPSTVPLFISSFGNGPATFDTSALDPVTGLPTDGDIADHLPPPGVQILPFTSDNWFYQNFSLAMRVIEPVPEPSSLTLLALAAMVLGAYAHRRIPRKRESQTLVGMNRSATSLRGRASPSVRLSISKE